jgi:hypothetical protein
MHNQKQLHQRTKIKYPKPPISFTLLNFFIFCFAERIKKDFKETETLLFG